MERQIIRIDEEKCDGCGICTEGCPEGALQMIDGKARLISEITCDGLGACIADCPQGAIQIEVREAAPYDERKTLDNIIPKGPNTLKAHLKHLHSHGQTTYLNQAVAYLQELHISIPDYKEKAMDCGCHGSAPRTLHREPEAPTREGLTSQLGQWPVQMHLISPMNPAFQKSDLLLAADCCAFAMADFNQKYLPGKTLAIACPKLDQNQQVYMDKMVALIDEAEVNTITVMMMEVPCCGGLLRLAQGAVERAQRKVPVKAIIVGVDGEIRKEAWV
ncbi:MAG: 4Fe-4S binding protein [Firmicutes bacterium]|nr:4Fe-4S binding protein [Bacillota bacterium]